MLGPFPLQELMAGNARALRLGRALPPAGERRPTAAVLVCTDERIVPHGLGLMHAQPSDRWWGQV